MFFLQFTTQKTHVTKNIFVFLTIYPEKQCFLTVYYLLPKKPNSFTEKTNAFLTIYSLLPKKLTHFAQVKNLGSQTLFKTSNVKSPKSQKCITLKTELIARALIYNFSDLSRLLFGVSHLITCHVNGRLF
jgi:hypothetical protein